MLRARRRSCGCGLGGGAPIGKLGETSLACARPYGGPGASLVRWARGAVGMGPAVEPLLREGPVMSGGSCVGVDVDARSVVAGVIDMGSCEVRSRRVPPGIECPRAADHLTQKPERGKSARWLGEPAARDAAGSPDPSVLADQVGGWERVLAVEIGVAD